MRTAASRGAPDGAADDVDVMGLRLDCVSEEEAIGIALAGAREGRGGWICPTNVDVLRQAVGDPAVRGIVEQADLVVADGMPLVWASRVQGTPLPERVAGSSLVTTLPRAAAQADASVYLLGGAAGVAEDAADRLVRASLQLRIAGTHCPPQGFEDAPQALATLERELVAARPDIVFVALGFPKQERLILRLRPLLPGTWFVSCGASLDFVSGAVPRAPGWAQRSGLEWLYRLALEPRRLARRYLVDGIPFVVRLMANALHRRYRPLISASR